MDELKSMGRSLRDLRRELDSVRFLLALRRRERVKAERSWWFLRSLKYSVDQPRDDWGRWTVGGASRRSDLVQLAGPPPEGHHYVPQAVFKALPLSPETRKVFRDGKTGELHGQVHRWSKEHFIYNDAVEEKLNRFMRERGIASEQMTPAQAQQFLGEVKSSSDPRIRNFNMRIFMREFQYYLRLKPRGNE